METQFYITLTLKTVRGPEGFAQFFIGNDRERAHAIFQKLEGIHDVSEGNVLLVEFRETIEGLPVNLKMMTCTLDQLAANCKIITKERFKAENLEER
jgi:hypothetical protein